MFIHVSFGCVSYSIVDMLGCRVAVRVDPGCSSVSCSLALSSIPSRLARPLEDVQMRCVSDYGHWVDMKQQRCLCWVRGSWTVAEHGRLLCKPARY